MSRSETSRPKTQTVGYHASVPGISSWKKREQSIILLHVFIMFSNKDSMWFRNMMDKWNITVYNSYYSPTTNRQWSDEFGFHPCKSHVWGVWRRAVGCAFLCGYISDSSGPMYQNSNMNNKRTFSTKGLRSGHLYKLCYVYTGYG